MITGCGLAVSLEYHFWGDLWEEGDCWIFNATGSEEGLDAPLNPNAKILYLTFSNVHYFQRRNVFVIHKGDAILNTPAVKYLEKTPCSTRS